MSLPPSPIEADDLYEIYALRYASAPERRVHNNFMWRDMHDGPMPMSFYIWIVRNARRTILVDTGFSQRIAAERGRPIDFNPIDGLSRIGIDPAEIEDVVVTHLHFDHAGNMDRLNKARFHVQDAEAAYATGRCMCNKFGRFAFDVEDAVTLVRRNFEGRVCFHDGDDDLAPGVSLISLPGHSAAVQGVQVKTARGPVLLASDATHYFANVLRDAPFWLTVDLPDTLNSYRRLREMTGGPELLIPGHDPKVQKLYRTFEINGVSLSALHELPARVSAQDLARVDGFD